MPYATDAQRAYTAYGQTTNGLNFLGQPMPTWDQLSPTQQAAWTNAAAAVRASADRDERADEPCTVTADCPHCPDGHPNPARRVWNAHVDPALTDGKPTRIIVGRPAGEHVAKVDAAWVYERLSGSLHT